MSAAHILVVDDEADIRGLLKEILSEEGYDVDVAGDAGQARTRGARLSGVSCHVHVVALLRKDLLEESPDIGFIIDDQNMCGAHARSFRGSARLSRATSCRDPVSYTHLRAHETPEHLVCRLLLEKK